MTIKAPWITHFGFTRTPFSKSLARSELFTRVPHQKAVARILHCVQESALGVVTGEVGAGKTVAARAARATLDPSRYQIIYIANPAFGTRGLYVTVVRALGASPRFFKAEVMAQAQELLEAEEAERHRRVVIVVDEAHLLSAAQLEELRLLTNSDMDSRSPFAGILLGQPTLVRQLRLGVFAAYVASAVMLRALAEQSQRRRSAGDAGRHNYSPWRKARTSSVGRYRPARTFAGVVRARARSLSAMSA